jgi:hypothetical protein
MAAPGVGGYSASRLRLQQVPDAEGVRYFINGFYVICKIIVLAYPGPVGHTDFVLLPLVRSVVVIREVIFPPCG